MNRKENSKRYWRKNGVRIVQKRRNSLFELLGEPVCHRCGFGDLRALQIDHVYGGGSKERKEEGKLEKIQIIFKSFVLIATGLKDMKIKRQLVGQINKGSNY